ncbi:hypothetical protein BV22DRAFT_1122604 [Leucogyrophana mollusca]|uniref:Uncharacterized protein n=1 Tax=Leucogyrophana mollusca TaxID=85980 RepID=A0ACB8B4K7_9AGAM|nr:hypothetical protein BV22DRAFT_1122604 [Leucogyrophana mollusca]
MTALYTAQSYQARYCGTASQLTLVSSKTTLETDHHSAECPPQWSCVFTGLLHVPKYSKFNSPRPNDKSTWIAAQWLSVLFTAAMQAILLMRAYVLWNHSNKLLVFLLSYFFSETIAVVIMAGILFNSSVVGKYVLSVGPGSVGSAIEEGLADSSVLAPVLTIAVIIQLAFDIVLLVVALFAAVKHALEARRLNNGWPTNPLVKALAADQFLYFF